MVRISRIAAQGFRGIRQFLSLDVPPGFLVLSGANGAGKSTVLDIVEMVLSGTILRYEGHTEGRESIQDYLWCAVGGESRNRYVEIDLVDSHGETLTFRRDQTGKCSNEHLLRELLCDMGTAPSNALKETCLTSIIRGDELTSLSVDLGERERYEFVRRAIGSLDSSAIEGRLAEVYELAKEKNEAREVDRGRKHEALVELITEISSLESELPTSREIQRATETLATELSLETRAPRSLADEARATLIRLKVRESAIIEAEQLLAAINETGEAQKEVSVVIPSQDHLLGEIARLDGQLRKWRERLEEIESELAACRQIHGRQDKLREMLILGRSIGLQDEKCPLCNSAVSADAFTDHIESMLAKSDSQSSKIEPLLGERERTEAECAKASRSIDEMKEMKRRRDSEHEKLSRMQERLKTILSDLGFHTEDVSQTPTVEELARDQGEAAKKASVISECLPYVESQLSITRLEELRNKLLEARRTLNECEIQTIESGKTLARVKEILDSVRRIANDTVDERLAQISPLLTELYARLQPHPEWSTLEYAIRGELRKFLSLRVGEDYNPRFIFSSGQRRAAGLAFSIAVQQTRSWAKLGTILLDDPVQHIDDFRSIHVVEVLAALRKRGVQVICAVEDSRLAELLERRLRSRLQDDGAHVRMEYRDGVRILDRIKVNPLPTAVMQLSG